MVNVIGVPVQVIPLLVTKGVTVKVEVSGVVPAFVAVNEGTLPVPFTGANPIASAVRVQLKTVPGVLLVNTTEGTDEPTQYV